MKVHPKYSNGPFKKVKRSFTVFISLILSLQKTGKQELQFNSSLMSGNYLSFSVKAKVYSEKFQETTAKVLPFNFSFFSLRERSLVNFAWTKRFDFRLTAKLAVNVIN